MIKVLSDSKADGKSNEVEYVVAPRRLPIVAVGDSVHKGQLLTDGSADINEIFKYGTKDLAEEYIIREINKVYELQGASISRKHLEIIIRLMFSRKKIKIQVQHHSQSVKMLKQLNFLKKTHEYLQKVVKKQKQILSFSVLLMLRSQQKLAFSSIIPKHKPCAYRQCNARWCR